jgi:hypothetical protein
MCAVCQLQSERSDEEERKNGRIWAHNRVASTAVTCDQMTWRMEEEVSLTQRTPGVGWYCA